MISKSLLLSGICIAVVTGCATVPPSTGLSSRARARQEALDAASISGGACDGAGQFIGAPIMSLSQEASAAPSHPAP